MICGVVIVARCKANRFLDRNRERKKRRWIQWWRKRREKEDRRRIENRNVIILSTALFTGEKRTIADPGGAHFHCRKSGGANAVVTRRFPLTCCPRVRVPRVFVAVGHEPCERDPCQNWIRWIRSVPRTAPPSSSTGQKVLLISLPQSLHSDPDFSICSKRFDSIDRRIDFIFMRQKWSNVNCNKI